MSNRNYITIQYMVGPEQHDAICQLSFKQHRTPSDLIREALDYILWKYHSLNEDIELIDGHDGAD